MASLQRNQKSGIFYVNWWYGGQQFSKSARTRDPATANAIKADVEKIIWALGHGYRTIPDGVDPGLYIFSGGEKTSKVVPGPPEAITLGARFDRYVASMEGIREPSTLKTERYHIARLSAPTLLGSSREVESITFADIQGYVNRRSKEKHHGTPIQPTTIKKELDTLRLIWRWARRLEHVRSDVPWRGKDLTFGRARTKEPFRSFDQIRRKIERGELSEATKKRLWECLYLTGGQLVEVLDHVETHATAPFVYPMFAFVALTGARRSEVLRSEIDDFDFDSESVTIRALKGRGDREIKTRQVGRRGTSCRALGSRRPLGCRIPSPSRSP
jgi:site-specific recombinase XerD